MDGAALTALAGSLCRTFLGWRLREDWDALVALGEGALRIDLLSGEAWCDADPIPPLFLAGELQRELAAGLVATGVSEADLGWAHLDALFRARRVWRGGREVPVLDVTCRATLACDAGEFTAEANNAGAGG